MTQSPGRILRHTQGDLPRDTTPVKCACPLHLAGDIGTEGSQEVVNPDLTPSVSPLSACVYPLYALPPKSETAKVLCSLPSRERQRILSRECSIMSTSQQLFLPPSTAVPKMPVIITLPVLRADPCPEATCQLLLRWEKQQQVQDPVTEGRLLLLELFQQQSSLIPPHMRLLTGFPIVLLPWLFLWNSGLQAVRVKINEL